MVDQRERACRAWPILIQEASLGHRQITYGQLSHRLGIHHRPIRYVLDLIQRYCMQNRLPPLTVLVVNQYTRRPGSGFIGCNSYEIDRCIERVLGYPWSSISNPFA